MPIDTALVGALHVKYLRKRDVRGIKHPHHALFQTSTIDALLNGSYEVTSGLRSFRLAAILASVRLTRWTARWSHSMATSTR